MNALTMMIVIMITMMTNNKIRAMLLLLNINSPEFVHKDDPSVTPTLITLCTPDTSTSASHKNDANADLFINIMIWP